ncbi:MAG: TonB-dependent receptor [Thiohalocapsa sp.]|nr:TonB-dependent receptor [Thiohalocapsa sp.]MCF7990927.1 TonB-dependent receptor [Thiohalocapsa sp.]
MNLSSQRFLSCRLAYAAIAPVYLAAASALAEDDAATLFGSEQSVSIATGSLRPLRTAPAVATVITAEEIRDYGVRNVVEALALVPGFHVGTTTDLYPNLLVRGFSSPRSGNTLVLLDGVSLTEMGQGDQLAVLGTLPLDAIERIEVTRGPGSSVFGADAFSAVVNVVTKRQAREPSVSLSGGSYDTTNARLLLGNSGQVADVVFAAEINDSDGYAPRIGIDNAVRIEEVLGVDASFAPTDANTARRSFGALVNVTAGQTRGLLRLSKWDDWGLGAGILGIVDPFGTRSAQTLQARLEQDFVLSDRFDATLTADFTEFTTDLDRVTWFPPSRLYPDGAVLSSSTVQSAWKLRLDARYLGFDKHILAFGAGFDYLDYRVDDAELNYAQTPIGPLPEIPGLIAADEIAVDYVRRVPFAYVQDEWLLAPKWTLTFGARVDDYSDVGTEVSPRAVLVWTPAPEWTAKLLYGEGFRAPWVGELEPLGTPIYRPNPSLRPERLRTAELFIGYRPSPDLDVGLNLYRHETDDQIRQQDRGIYIQPENVGDQVGEGVELQGDWRLSERWSLGGWYAYQYNTDETTGRNAGYTPQHRAFASVRFTEGNAFLNLRAHYVGDRARVAEDPRDEPDDYVRLDLLGRYDFDRRFSVQLDVRNLLNSNDREPAPGTGLPQDIPLPGRNYYLTFRVRF